MLGSVSHWHLERNILSHWGKSLRSCSSILENIMLGHWIASQPHSIDKWAWPVSKAERSETWFGQPLESKEILLINQLCWPNKYTKRIFLKRFFNFFFHFFSGFNFLRASSSRFSSSLTSVVVISSSSGADHCFKALCPSWFSNSASKLSSQSIHYLVQRKTISKRTVMLPIVEQGYSN